MSWKYTDVCDRDPPPIFLEFSRTFRNKSQIILDREIDDFMVAHPHLDLVLMEEINTTVPVLGAPNG